MKKETLCWTCHKAIPGNSCPWSDFGAPVKGWGAVEHTIAANSEHKNTYRVYYCPLYLLDARLRDKTCDMCIKYGKCSKIKNLCCICADFEEPLSYER